MDYTLQNSDQSSKSEENPEKKRRPLWLRVTRFIFKGILIFLVGSILWVIVLKWVPVYVTPHMLIQSFKAWWAGQPAKIDYEWVSYDEISEHMFVAVVASEDQKFPTHNGFDWESLSIAYNNYLRNNGSTQQGGGSTISQQVAKNVFMPHQPAIIRKPFEAYFTVLIELIWGKKRILEVYVNIAEMGKMTFGVQAASKKYFLKSAKNIVPYEAATLAAVLPNPILYSAQNPDWYVNTRRNQIVYQMQMLGGYSYLQGIK